MKAAFKRLFINCGIVRNRGGINEFAYKIDDEKALYINGFCGVILPLIDGIDCMMTSDKGVQKLIRESQNVKIGTINLKDLKQEVKWRQAKRGQYSNGDNWQYEVTAHFFVNVFYLMDIIEVIGGSAEVMINGEIIKSSYKDGYVPKGVLYLKGPEGEGVVLPIRAKKEHLTIEYPEKVKQPFDQYGEAMGKELRRLAAYKWQFCKDGNSYFMDKSGHYMVWVESKEYDPIDLAAGVFADRDMRNYIPTNINLRIDFDKKSIGKEDVTTLIDYTAVNTKELKKVIKIIGFDHFMWTGKLKYNKGRAMAAEPIIVVGTKGHALIMPVPVICD